MAFDKDKKFTVEADVLKVLGHPIRLKIVAGLCTQECNVKHIWECLGLPQATVSQHLALLKNKGIAKVANLAGGMLRWRAQRFPVEGGAD